MDHKWIRSKVLRIGTWSSLEPQVVFSSGSSKGDIVVRKGVGMPRGQHRCPKFPLVDEKIEGFLKVYPFNNRFV